MWSCCYHITQSSLVKEHHTIDNLIVGRRHLHTVDLISNQLMSRCWWPLLTLPYFALAVGFPRRPHLNGNPVRRAYPMQTTEFVIGNRDSLIFIGWWTTEYRLPFLLRLHFRSTTPFWNVTRWRPFLQPSSTFYHVFAGCQLHRKNFIVATQVQALTKPFQYDNTILIYHTHDSVNSQMK